jgi:PAS domain S-box-containing protein
VPSQTCELQQQIDLSQWFLAALGEGLAVVDAKGCLLYLNDAGQRILGWTHEELLGRNLHDTIHYQKADGSWFPMKECPLYQVLNSGIGFANYEDALIHKDGDIIPVFCSCTPIFGVQGQTIGAIKTFQDIRNLKAIEAQLLRTKAEAETTARLKSEFLANMSHEIRTPMNGILGTTHLLLNTSLNTEQYEYASLIRTSAESLLVILNDILDLSKIQAGKLALDPQPFDLARLLEDLTECLLPNYLEKKVDLLVRLDPHVPLHYVGDTGRIRQVLHNLLSNALKFTQQGQVFLEVESLHTSNISHQAPDQLETPYWVRFSVHDTGIGIDRDKLSLIFDKFTQADSSTSRKFGGTGLGLAICKQLCQMMGGTIGVDSERDRGSHFWFALPMKPCVATAPAIDRLASAQTPLHPGRILVADANTTSQQILSELLCQWGLDVALAGTGHAALATLQQAAAGPTPFSLMLVDQHLPDMSATRLAEAMQENPVLRQTRPILLTHCMKQDPDTEARLTRAGFSAWLRKPIFSAALRATLCAVQERQLQHDTQIQTLITRYSLLEDGKLPGRTPPATLISAVSSASTASTPMQPAPGALVHCHVLLAEDNLVNQKVMTRMLEKQGVTVDVAENGMQVLEKLQHHTYDLVLMDCQMPEMDGLEATQLLRQRDIRQRNTAAPIPVVAITANALPGEAEHCLAVGMNDYLAKPIHPDALYAKLLAWLPPRVSQPTTPQ